MRNGSAFLHGAICAGRYTHYLFENAGEIIGVVYTDHMAYLIDF